jgi:pantetheine-phosphate adenylyltransferase
LDLIKRTARLFNSLTIAVAGHRHIKHALFTATERQHLLQKSVQTLTNTRVVIFDNLFVDFARQTNASVVIRGLRTVSDFNYEMQLSNINKLMQPHLEYVFIPADPEYCYISASIVKEIASLKGDVSRLVPEHVAQALSHKLAQTVCH